MKYKLEWQNEEEGILTCFDGEDFCFVVNCYVTGPEDAELQIQDIVSGQKNEKNDNLREEIILKMTECLSECFRLLWEEGYEETVLVEKNGTKFAETLNSTDVVQKCYSEYMMKRYIKTEKSTDCGLDVLNLTKEADGFCCENKEKTFFCKLLNYEANAEERCFYLYEVEVAENVRNKGIATKCLNRLFQMLAAEQPTMVYLQVGSYNEPAVHLYKKLGFEISEELCYYTMNE